MKYLALALGMFLALAASTVSAQTIDMHANIPFAFRVGDSVMPAGEYRVQTLGPVLVVRGEHGSRPIAQVIPIPALRPAGQKPGRLEFNRYGENYFLTKVWDSFSAGGRALLKTSQEKELAARNGAVQTATVLAQRK